MKMDPKQAWEQMDIAMVRLVLDKAWNLLLRLGQHYCATSSILEGPEDTTKRRKSKPQNMTMNQQKYSSRVLLQQLRRAAPSCSLPRQ
jgi:hypothetical protein